MQDFRIRKTNISMFTMESSVHTRDPCGLSLFIVFDNCKDKIANVNTY